MGVELHADEARETGDGRAETADVHTQQEAAGVLGEAREQQRRGDIADDLTR